MSGLFGSVTIKGNRITDFSDTTATVGVPIPFGYGRFVTGGNVIWAPLPPKEHVTKKRQGKGGVKQETYTYTLSYAICFARGPIYGFWWIKRNGKIVWTQDPNAPVEDKAYADKWRQKATFYYGTTTQLPDSTIESYEGSGQVSAFRRDAYIVVEDDDVTDGGGAVPTYEACVIATPPEAYLISPPYAQYQRERNLNQIAPTGGSMVTVVIPSDAQSESNWSSIAPTGGSLITQEPPVLEAEAHYNSVAPTGGTLNNVLRVGRAKADATTNQIAPTGGILKAPPKGTVVADATANQIAPTGGALTTI